MEATQKIRIKITGLGHCPSFKNSKVLFVRNGKPGMATKEEYKLWMQRTSRAIESQLLCSYQTTAQETQTEPVARSLIAWCRQYLPLDDSVKWIPEIEIKVHRVKKGEEGAVMIIEKIS